MTGIIKLDYTARPYFVPFHQRKQRYACIVMHRRGGKTVACINDLQDAALRCEKQRPRFAYISPYRSQSKTVAWDYLRAAMSPLRQLGATVNESELRVDYHNGGQVRLFGADDPDSLRGIYLDGVVLDEPAQIDPRLWPSVIRPALSDRRGWAVFIGTPQGRNSFHKIWMEAQTAPDEWFTLMLKASDIVPLNDKLPDALEQRLLTTDELEAARRSMSEDQFSEEYECNFDAATVGTYYAKLMLQAESDKRITGVPYEPTAQVWTAWDLGISDATSIWFAQTVGKEIRIIDYYEASGADLGHYVSELAKKNYSYAGHIVPHDAQAKELGTGKTRLEVLESLGMRNITVAPMHRVEDGINAVRVMLPKCWFDAVKCDRGIEAMKLYRAESDNRRVDPNTNRPILKPRPLHDWTSHAADAFRYLAMTLDGTRKTNFNKPIQYPKYGVA